jgi:hypothetical protein
LKSLIFEALGLKKVKPKVAQLGSGLMFAVFFFNKTQINQFILFFGTITLNFFFEKNCPLKMGSTNFSPPPRPPEKNMAHTYVTRVTQIT